MVMFAILWLASPLATILWLAVPWQPFCSCIATLCSQSDLSCSDLVHRMRLFSQISVVRMAACVGLIAFVCIISLLEYNTTFHFKFDGNPSITIYTNWMNW